MTRTNFPKFGASQISCAHVIRRQFDVKNDLPSYVFFPAKKIWKNEKQIKFE